MYPAWLLEYPRVARDPGAGASSDSARSLEEPRWSSACPRGVGFRDEVHEVEVLRPEGRGSCCQLSSLKCFSATLKAQRFSQLAQPELVRQDALSRGHLRPGRGVRRLVLLLCMPAAVGMRELRQEGVASGLDGGELRTGGGRVSAWVQGAGRGMQAARLVETYQDQRHNRCSQASSQFSPWGRGAKQELLWRHDTRSHLSFFHVIECALVRHKCFQVHRGPPRAV